MNPVKLKNTHCANLKVSGCTEDVTERGNILCKKCRGVRAVEIKQQKEDDNEALIRYSNKIERELANLKTNYENVMSHHDTTRSERIRELELTLSLLENKNEELSIIEEELNKEIDKNQKLNFEITKLNKNLIEENRILKQELIDLHTKTKSEIKILKENVETLRTGVQSPRTSMSSPRFRPNIRSPSPNQRPRGVSASSPRILSAPPSPPSTSLRSIPQSPRSGKPEMSRVQSNNLPVKKLKLKKKKVSKSITRSKPALSMSDKFKRSVESNLPHKDPMIEVQRKKS
jgi:hypothetical protein